MRGRGGRGSTTSRGMISSSSGVRPNQQPTTVTSEKVRPGDNANSATCAFGDQDVNTLAVCREAVDVPDSQRRGSHHEDRPAQQPAGVRGSEQQNQPRSGIEVKDRLHRDACMS